MEHLHLISHGNLENISPAPSPYPYQNNNSSSLDPLVRFPNNCINQTTGEQECMSTLSLKTPQVQSSDSKA